MASTLGQPFLKQQKKQTSACDGCRKSKTRCNGETPCARCTKRKMLCTYSPQKRRGVRKRQPASGLSKGAHPTNGDGGDEANRALACAAASEALLADATCQGLLDLFFTYTNNTLPRPLNRCTMELHKSKASLMQYYVALAFSSRSSKQKKLSQSFERKARALAGDLFDDFSFETAAAFAMLTSYYWGQDERKCAYYGAMTQGLCNDLSKHVPGAATDPRVILLEVMACCNIVKFDSQIKSLMERMKITMETSDKSYLNQIRIALLLAEVKFALIRAHPITDERRFLQNMIAPTTLRSNMSPEMVDHLLRKIATAQRLATEEPLASKYAHTWPLIQAILVSFESMLYFAKQNDHTAQEKVEELLDICDNNKDLLAFAPPAIVQCIHFAFSACYMYRNINLAMRATGLMRLLSHILPMAEIPLWSDTKHLKMLLMSGRGGHSGHTLLADYPVGQSASRPGSTSPPVLHHEHGGQNCEEQPEELPEEQEATVSDPGYLLLSPNSANALLGVEQEVVGNEWKGSGPGVEQDVFSRPLFTDFY